MNVDPASTEPDPSSLLCQRADADGVDPHVARPDHGRSGDHPGAARLQDRGRHSPSDLAETLGAGFVVIENKREEHVTPAGVRQPFTWVAARVAE
jgi:hypothetical protein